MSDILLAKRYAQAIFDMALEFKKTEEIKADMELLSEVTKESRDFRLFLKSPVIRNDKKLKTITDIFHGKVDEITEKFFRLVIKQNRESHLSEIAAQYMELYKAHHNIITAHVTTPVEMSAELRAKITDLIGKHTKGNVELVEHIDESIIGGFIIKFDDQEYDASLLNQVNRLRKEFEENLYIKKY